MRTGGGAGEDSILCKSAVTVVVIEVIGAAIVRDIKIGPAVVIVISPHDPHAMQLARVAHRCLLRDIFECSIAAIAEEKVAFAFHFVGHLEDDRPVSLHMRIGRRKVMKVCFHVAGNKQIEVAVAVVIGPGSSGAEAGRFHACSLSHILELASPQVVVQHVVSIACHVEVRQAVVVIVANCDPHSPSARGQSRSLGGIGEMEIAATSILVVQRDHRVAACHEAVDRGIVHNRNVKPSVVVAIEECDSAPSHCLHDVSPLGD